MAKPMVTGVSRICRTLSWVTNGCRHSHPFQIAVMYVR